MAGSGSKGEKTTQRRLAAILCADVAGYSRLMGADEEATIETLTAYRKVFLSAIGRHRGRVVDAKGDAILAEFGSVVDAVTAAVEIQRELGERNAALPEERRMEFRIGINLGDVVVKDDVIYGDGVNVAARLESLAEPGGVCVSRPVYDQVKAKLKLEYEYLGEQQVKNIAEPVRAYQVSIGAVPEPTVGDSAAGAAPEKSGADFSMLEGRPLPLPDKPSIAVLAFDNLSGDQEQEHFSDGISEDIITDLSKISGLFVIGRNSSFCYKGRNTDLRQIGRELGVRYVLEGSVRTVRSHVRVTAQLVEAASGHHIWANRFDRELDDVFLVGDEITEEIVTALDVELVSGEQARVYRKALKTPKGRELYYRGMEYYYRPSKENNLLARELFEAVIREEPDSPIGYGYTGITHVRPHLSGWGGTLKESLQAATTLAAKALELDEHNPGGHAVMALVSLLMGNHDEAIHSGELCVANRPVCATPRNLLATILLFAGMPEEAIPQMETAMRITPVYPDDFLHTLALAHFLCGHFEKAVTISKTLAGRNPEHQGAHVVLTCAYGAMGRTQDANAGAEIILAKEPSFSATKVFAAQPFKDMAVPDTIREWLRKAGLPD